MDASLVSVKDHDLVIEDTSARTVDPEGLERPERRDLGRSRIVVDEQATVIEIDGSELPLLDTRPRRADVAFPGSKVWIEGEPRANRPGASWHRVAAQIAAKLRDGVVVIRSVVVLDHDHLTERAGVDQPPLEALPREEGFLLRHRDVSAPPRRGSRHTTGIDDVSRDRG